jgi:hypothetical protein
MKYMMIIFSVCAVLWSISGCTKEKATPASPPSVTIPKKTEFAALSWEKNHPERKAWSTFVFEFVSAEVFEALDGAKDAKRICPKYEVLSRDQRILVWGELISGMTYFESGWSPTSRMTETTMGTDPVTGKQVASEGLLQLSYQDVPNYGSVLKYPLCKIEWAKDKSLSLTDPKKTILDPFINLECGLRILANQVQKKGSAILSNGVYWAVLKEGGKYSKVDSIIAMIAKTGLCN